MIDRTIVFNNYLGASFPNFAGKDASGAAAVDGTEWQRRLLIIGPGAGNKRY